MVVLGEVHVLSLDLGSHLPAIGGDKLVFSLIPHQCQCTSTEVNEMLG